MAGSAAKAEIGMRLRIWPIGAKYEHVDAEHAEYGVHGTAAVAGRLHEDARIHRAPRERVGAAAGSQALAVQRAKTR